MSWRAAGPFPPATPPVWISSARWCFVESPSRRSASSSPRPRGRHRTAGARAPFPDVAVVPAHARALRRLVDGDLEARVEDDLARAPGVLGDDLRGDVAPPDDHSWASQAAPAATAAAMDGASSPNPVEPALESETEAVGRGLRACGQLGVVGLGEIDERR